MEHADTAQLAAVGGALGSVLVLLARGRLTLLGGLVVLAAAEAGAGALARRRVARQAHERCRGARGRRGDAAARRGAAVLAWRPAWVSVAVLATAPFRPPLDFSGSNRFLVSIAEDGRLGRLLPLYFVLAAAAAALGWRALRGRSRCGAAAVIALPAAAFFTFAFLSLLWADDVEAGTNLLAFFTLPFVVLLATVGARRLPRLGAARAGGRARSRWRPCSP